MSLKRVLVVGTTSDYIDIITRRYPGRGLFITDGRERGSAVEPAPPATDEVLVDLSDKAETLALVQEHLSRWSLEASGVTCFDCESMALASYLADAFMLPYHSLESITACRSKVASKLMWQSHGLACPRVELVHSLAEAVSFLEGLGRPIVLKPLTGSGSELVFKCGDRLDCSSAFAMISNRLASHPNERMYEGGNGSRVDARHVFAAEEFIRGREYSCDFVVENDRIEIIRVARKIPATNQPIGTTLAYIVPASLPGGLTEERLAEQLGKAARSVGLQRAIVMVDFIVREGQAVLIEMTPRPGGDCLPPLLQQVSGFDMLGFALDFAEGKSLEIADRSSWKHLVGVRLFAESAGVIKSFDTSRITADPRVKECYLKRTAGHRVVLPPQDYDSRVLGHIIFQPRSADSIEAESRELAAKLAVEIEPTSWVRLIQS